MSFKSRDIKYLRTIMDPAIASGKVWGANVAPYSQTCESCIYYRSASLSIACRHCIHCPDADIWQEGE